MHKADTERQRPKMRDWLRRLGSPPTLATMEETRKAQRLYTILLALLLMIFVLIPIYALYQWLVPGQLVETLSIILGSIAVFGSALLFLLRGQLRLARAIFIVYFYLGTIAAGLVFDGIYDSALTAFFLLIGVVGLVGGGTDAFLSAVAGAGGLLVVYLLDFSSGGLEVLRQPPLVKVLEMSGFLLLLGLVLRMTLADRKEALVRAQEEVRERKKAEESLREAHVRLEERVVERTIALTRVNRNLETLIETNRDGVLFLTGKGELTVVNSRALELLELPGEPAAWQGRHLEELIRAFREKAPVEPAVIEAEMGRILASEKDLLDGEIVLPGRYLHWYSTRTVVGEELPARLLVLRDVTAQRQAEQMRNDLVNTMVHDLRNPLSSMLSLLSTLTWMDNEGREGLTERQRRYVERSMDTVVQMNQLVSNILDVSRLESGQMPVQPEVVPVQETIREVVLAQRALAQEKELRLYAEIPGDLPSARVDMALLERILQNLLDNAIKFTPPGGQVRVSASQGSTHSGTTSTIDIAVADTGPGIDPSLEGELFQKFVAGDYEECGSGLGLAFCKLAVEAQGGQIGVKSEIGKGTIFKFSVPAA